jgi:hypothetical protein
MTRPVHTPARGLRRTAAVAALALAAAGCGIQGTTVPVDAGSAPARVSCKIPAVGGSPDAGGRERVAVYLVCGATLAQVERTVPAAEGTTAADTRLGAARALLTELRKPRSAAEDRAGFSSAVPEDLAVTGPRAGDPTDALRLSIRPGDLPSFALAQLVCTYGASTTLGRSHAAVLGGPGDDVPQRYDCSTDVLTNPDIAQNAGWGDPMAQQG